MAPWMGLFCSSSMAMKAVWLDTTLALILNLMMSAFLLCPSSSQPLIRLLAARWWRIGREKVGLVPGSWNGTENSTSLSSIWPLRVAMQSTGENSWACPFKIAYITVFSPLNTVGGRVGACVTLRPEGIPVKEIFRSVTDGCKACFKLLIT